MSVRLMSPEQVAARIQDGMVVGIGGWGSRRKPMTLVRALAKSPVKDLTVVSYGGPDVGILCALGKVKKLVYGFVSLDSIPLEPHFRTARQEPGHEYRACRGGRLRTALGEPARRHSGIEASHHGAA